MARPLTSTALAVLLQVFTFIGAQADTRGFRATLDLVQAGPPAPDAPCAAPMVLVSLSGTGAVARMGRVDAEASHCIIDDPAEEDFTNGILQLANARGSLLIEYSGVDSAGHLEGSFTIVGGTGLFAGASGGGTLTGSADPFAGRGVVHLDGSVSTP